MTIQDGPPVGAVRDGVEIVDKEADDAVQRDTSGWQVQLVQRQRIAGTVGVQVGPRHIVARELCLRMSVPVSEQLVAFVGDPVGVLVRARRPEAAMSINAPNDESVAEHLLECLAVSPVEDRKAVLKLRRPGLFRLARLSCGEPLVR